MEMILSIYGVIKTTYNLLPASSPSPSLDVTFVCGTGRQFHYFCSCFHYCRQNHYGPYFKKKERLQKSPSKIPPPSESPAWTVSATFKHTMDATGNADTSPTGTVNSTPTAPVTSASKTARRLLNVELTAFDSSLSDSDLENYFDSSLSDSDSEN